MPNSLQSSAIASPASRRATNCSLSSITEHSFQGIIPSPLRGESVTYVSGTMCYLCLRPLTPVNTRGSSLCFLPWASLRHHSINHLSTSRCQLLAQSEGRYYWNSAGADVAP